MKRKDSLVDLTPLRDLDQGDTFADHDGDVCMIVTAPNSELEDGTVWFVTLDDGILMSVNDSHRVRPTEVEYEVVG